MNMTKIFSVIRLKFVLTIYYSFDSCCIYDVYFFFDSILFVDTNMTVNDTCGEWQW